MKIRHRDSMKEGSQPPFYVDGLSAIRCSKCGRMYAFPRPVLNEYGAVVSHGRPYCPSCKK